MKNLINIPIEELKIIRDKSLEVSKTQGYDSRRKEYKEAKRELENLNKEGVAIIQKEFSLALRNLGLNFNEQGILLFEDGFKVYVNVWFNNSSFDKSYENNYFSVSIGICPSSNRSYENESNISNKAESIQDIKANIEKERLLYNNYQETKRINLDNIRKFRKAVESEITKYGRELCYDDGLTYWESKGEVERIYKVNGDLWGIHD